VMGWRLKGGPNLDRPHVSDRPRCRIDYPCTERAVTEGGCSRHRINRARVGAEGAASDQRVAGRAGNQDADPDDDGCVAPPPPARPAPSFLDERLGVEIVQSRRRRPGRPVLLDLHHNDAIVVITMFSVNKVDPDTQALLHDQVAAELRRALAQGEALPGERLPPAKDLAAVLGVNVNTVFRALRQLRDEGLLTFRRGRGVTVAGIPERALVVREARDFVAVARRHGYRRQEIVELIERLV
jgi:GntR family transcriptional regulator